ncbi:DM13 domain-containing protein [uncultured Jatrophihabitans sp.]|uniref:DM13 domain-containing protein n=1 Tax=uncultured Jatrophihabitans sp. TaxID=1610747 RepID=UPI0035CC265D
MAAPRRRRRILWSAAALVAAAVVATGLAWFQPWKLVVDHRVDEKLPAVAETSPTQAPPTVPPATAPSLDAARPTPTRPSPSQAVLLSRGRLISHEHSTSGTVSVVRQPDGSRVLAVADLDTSDGPDVHVWLTDAPVLRGEKGWHVFDDGTHVNLGTLKGNLGNQVYRIPKDADLRTLTSVTIWCKRFSVSFGAAELAPVG